MESLNLFAAAPEIALLACACFILLADLFIPDERRNLTYGLTMAALVLVAGICWFFFANDLVQYAFGGMYVTDPMASVLKVFSALCVGTMLVYAQGYARDRGIWKGELFALALFCLLGIFVMISANNLLVIYLGLELQALSMYSLIALRRDDARATEAAMKYFVLGALAWASCCTACRCCTGLPARSTSTSWRATSPAARWPAAPPWSWARCSWSPDWRSSSAWCRFTCGCPMSITARRRR